MQLSRSDSNPTGGSALLELADIYSQTISGARPREARQAVIEMVVQNTTAERASLYLLDLGSGAYIEEARVGESKTFAPAIASKQLSGARDLPGDPIFRAAMSNRLARYEKPKMWHDIFESDSASAVVLPGCRLSTCLAVLVLESSNSDAFVEDEIRSLMTLGPVLCTLYDQRFQLQLLDNLQTPLDFKNSSEADFLLKLRALLEPSTSMEFIAIRELVTPDHLQTLDVWGFGDRLSRTDYDIRRGDSGTEPFWHCVDSRSTVSVESVDLMGLQSLRRFAKEVESFVVAPILLGNEVFGTLSLAARCEFEFSAAEQLGFLAIANGIGIAIENFRNFEQARDSFAKTQAALQAITAVTVAQTARHEARYVVDDIQSNLTKLRMGIRNKKDRKDLVAIVDAISARALEINKSFDEMRSIESGEKMERSEIWLSSLWDWVRHLSAGRLSRLRIDASELQGGDVLLYVDQRRIRQVLYNLVLNTMEAFEPRRTTGRQRRIGLRIESTTASGGVVVLYTDNAGGLDISAVEAAASSHGQSLSPTQAIFARGFTTKPEGTGYGLFVCRRLMAMHDKSNLDLRPSSEGGVVFELEFSAPCVVELAKG